MLADLLFSSSFHKRVTACFAGVALVFIFAPLLIQGTPVPYWFHDSFFNTLKIVENFRLKGFPTFDGVTPTNDFSPFWALVLYGLSAVVPVSSNAFFILVRFVLTIGFFLSLWLFNRLVDALGYQSEKEVRFLSSAFLMVLFFYSAHTGADAVWAIPVILINALCLLKALNNPSVFSGFVCGLSVSLCVLFRFDSIVFFLTALLVFYFQFNLKEPVTTKQALKILLGLIIGLIPLMAYADMEQTKFGSPVPAELLSWGKSQDTAPWRLMWILFFEPLRYLFRMPEGLILLLFPTLLLLLVAYVSFPWNEEKQTPKDTVFYALIWYPLVYLFGLAFLTFLTLPKYAFYPFAIGVPFALIFAASRIHSKIREEKKDFEIAQALRAWVVLGGLLIFLSVLQAIQISSEVYIPVVQTISEFTEQHPGRYAMGKGAGIISFLTKKDFVRLDGKAEDTEF